VAEVADPVVSVIVVIVSDTMDERARVDHLPGCLDALRTQVDVPPIEIIVPHHARTDGIDALAARYRDVRFIAVSDPAIDARRAGSREHHDMLRARGLALARGKLVALLEDHARPDPRWCNALVAAHRSGDAAIGGAIENDVDRPLNWAVWFCDFGRYQNPLPAGPSPFASDANTAYKRDALESVRRAWEASFNEVIVNGALMASGATVALSPEMVVFQHRSDLALGDALRERYIWGRSYAEARSRELGAAQRAVHAVASPILPLVLMGRIAATAWSRRRHVREFMRCAPLIALLTLCWCVGEGTGYAAARRPAG